MLGEESVRENHSEEEKEEKRAMHKIQGVSPSTKNSFEKEKKNT